MKLYSSEFFHKKRIFITGHTGFKGAWLSIWLASLGAELTGYSLDPPTHPSLYALADVKGLLKKSVIGNVLDFKSLQKAAYDANPEIIIHMAAQSLVRESYRAPVNTYATNVMGTVNVLEVARTLDNLKVILNITTDKVYENKEWVWGYRENEALGGLDPYSSSKACSELVTQTYRESFFHSSSKSLCNVGIATARAGNVVGGGDFATDRLVPDIVRSMLRNEKILIRNPNSLRPWQHVVEPLYGYMMLIEKLYKDGSSFSESWNFGPYQRDANTVIEIISIFKKISERKKLWNIQIEIEESAQFREAQILKLDISKSITRIGWEPKWNIEDSIENIIDWTKHYHEQKNIRAICLRQIEEYFRLQK